MIEFYENRNDNEPYNYVEIKKNDYYEFICNRTDIIDSDCTNALLNDLFFENYV